MIWCRQCNGWVHAGACPRCGAAYCHVQHIAVTTGFDEPARFYHKPVCLCCRVPWHRRLTAPLVRWLGWAGLGCSMAWQSVREAWWHWRERRAGR